MSARQLVALYGRRMQIESSFRDLKSHRDGHGFEDSLTGKRRRLDLLLLVNALASFAQWLAGLGCEATGIDQWLYPAKRGRKLYSTLRVGREALVRSWPLEPIWKMAATAARTSRKRVRSDGRAIMKNVGIPQTLTLDFNVMTGSCTGTTVVGLAYDVQGNLANKNGQVYAFDYGNRLRSVAGKEWYARLMHDVPCVT